MITNRYVGFLQICSMGIDEQSGEASVAVKTKKKQHFI